MTPTILIVGGGFSGVAVTHALSRLSWPEGVRVVLADRSNTFGRGAAYSTDHPSHVLNVPAGRMG
ncbi:MAG TPA: FAD/NAD(P)-binding protein, partial [Candidatus Krumholzibacteria bacterium]|nr:FAD/NAD(P)-binding protein [Candidatus Krumholzibacteria bacterium]